MYSLGVQREISHSIIWVAQYVGNIQWHQNIVNNALNAMVTNPGSTTETWTDPVTLIAHPGTVEDPRCLSGDSSGKGYNPANLPTATPAEYDLLPDHLCNAGFQQTAGFNQFRQYQGYAGASRMKTSPPATTTASRDSFTFRTAGAEALKSITPTRIKSTSSLRIAMASTTPVDQV